MFNLVGKRFTFLLVSLAVIIPGTLSLLVFHLNVGIDFAGGSTIEMRPSQNITVAQLQSMLKPLKLIDLQVISGENTSIPAKQVIWVRLNAQIDPNVSNTIQSDLQKKYGSNLSVTFDDLLLAKKVTVVTITKFPQGTTPNVNDVQTLLMKLPNTTDVTKAAATPTVGPSPTIAPTPTVQVTATAHPTATATVGKGTPTPTVVPTATATPTTNNPAATIPVNVVDIQTGNTTSTLTVRTSVVDPKNLTNNIRATIYNASNIYTYVLTNAAVTASVASDTTSRAILAVLAASVFILLYIWFSFRKVLKPWRYGACAIIALLHDVLVVLGIFSILGWTLGIQIDSLFITAVLTVVGFSVHDTIVVFDRIRENMQRRTSETFDQVVNASLVQTMARSLNTSMTVIFTLSALTLFGGVTIRNFTLALLVGIISGTYSSIFNASMLLVIWEKGELGFNRLSRDRTPDGRDVRELVRSRG